MAPLSVHSPGRGHPHPDSEVCGALLGHRPEPGVRGDAAPDQQVVDALGRGGVERLADQYVADGLLEADAATSATGTGSPVRSRASTQRATAVLSPENEKSKRCRSRSRRTGQAAREVDVDTVAVAGGPVDVGAARERQAEQPGHLVERLTRRVVDRRAERVDVAGDVGDAQQAGVATAHQQRQARLGQRAVLELVDGDVGGQVVDAVQRLARDRARAPSPPRRPTSSAPARPGPLVTAIASTSWRREPGGLAGPLDGRHHRLEVGPAGDLGHHAAEPGVLVDAAGDGVGEQGVAADDADAGLVARRLDAEDQRPARSSRSLRRGGRRPQHDRGRCRRGSSAAAGRPRRSRRRRRRPAHRRCPRAPRAAAGRRRRPRPARPRPRAARVASPRRRDAGVTAIRCSSATSADDARRGVRRRPRRRPRRPGSGRSARRRQTPSRPAPRDQASGPRQSASSAAIGVGVGGGGRPDHETGLRGPGGHGVGPAQVERLGVAQLGPLLGDGAGQPAGARAAPARRACGKASG